MSSSAAFRLVRTFVRRHNGVDEEGDKPLDPDFPWEPPEGASFFELQQYVCSQTEYTVDPSILARGKPKVVEADGDLPDKRHE